MGGFRADVVVVVVVQQTAGYYAGFRAWAFRLFRLVGSSGAFTSFP